MSETQTGTHRAEIETLLKAGTHFGHLTSRWNPKVKPFVFMERNGIHIIDLTQTQELLDKAADAAARFARQGKKILFTGTKKQAREILRSHATACGQPYVVERWLGGTLTNFQTIRDSIRRMENLVRMEADGTLDQLKKKERLMKRRERQKLEKVLTGIAGMARLPGAMFVVDINREHIAVKEARKLRIPIIALLDTNCDPDLVDFPIPANDDALKSIDLISSVIANAIGEGSKHREIEQAASKAEKEKRALEEAEAKGEKKKKTVKKTAKKATKKAEPETEKAKTTASTAEAKTASAKTAKPKGEEAKTVEPVAAEDAKMAADAKKEASKTADPKSEDPEKAAEEATA